jgi:hypothetical protein
MDTSRLGPWTNDLWHAALKRFAQFFRAGKRGEGLFY